MEEKKKPIRHNDIPLLIQVTIVSFVITYIKQNCLLLYLIFFLKNSIKDVAILLSGK